MVTGSQAENPGAQEPTSDHGDRHGRFTVHVVFAIVFLFMVATKYVLYFSPSSIDPGLTGLRVGATLGHLLIWALAYSMCLGTKKKLLMCFLAAPTLFFGILTFPFLGYLGLICMFIVYKTVARKPNEAQQQTQA